MILLDPGAGPDPTPALWDTIDRKIRLRLEAKTGNTPKPEEPEECCPSPKWGVIWVIIAFIFFAAGVLVGLVVFKVGI